MNQDSGHTQPMGWAVKVRVEECGRRFRHSLESLRRLPKRGQVTHDASDLAKPNSTSIPQNPCLPLITTAMEPLVAFSGKDVNSRLGLNC